MKNESTRKVVNVDKPNYVPLFEFKELDNAVIRLSLFKDSVEFDITGQTVKLGAKTSKGLKEQSEGFTINKNNLDIDLKNSILVPGAVEIDLELKDVSGTMTTASFFITVKSKVLNNKAVEGTNEFDTFTKTVAKVAEDYKGLRRIIIEENQAADLQDQVNQTNAHLETITYTQLENKAPFGERKPIISIVDDDGKGEVLTRLKPVLGKYNFPATLGIISSMNFINDSDLKELENNGWEIASHTVNHLSLSTLTLEEAEFEAKESQKQLKARGFNVTTMVYPFGGHNLEIRKMIRKYYECAVQVSGSKPYNEIPCQQYNLRRIAVGSYFEKPNENTYEWYKAQIDSAIENNGWIILMTHVGATEHTVEQQAIFEQLIDYIATLNVDVLTVRDAMKFYGNTVFTGDYTGNPNTDIYSVITNTGERYENNFRTVEKRKINNTTPLKDFPLGVSYNDFLTGDNAGFPPSNNAGLLITYRCANLAEQSNFQEFHIYNSPRMFKRVWLGNSWGAWAEVGLNVSLNVIISNSNQFSSTSTPTDFQTGKITYTEISSVGSAGFPNNAPGTLITYKVSSDVNYCYQEYKFRNSEKKYIRSYVGTSWSTWRIVQTGVASTTQNITATISAGSTYVHNFTFTGVKQYDVIHVSPCNFEATLYGLVITGVIKGVDNASIVLTNLSQSVINLNNKAFVCSVISN